MGVVEGLQRNTQLSNSHFALKLLSLVIFLPSQVFQYISLNLNTPGNSSHEGNIMGNTTILNVSLSSVGQHLNYSFNPERNPILFIAMTGKQHLWYARLDRNPGDLKFILF